MMNVKEVSSKGLKREFLITVPRDEVEKSLTQRLEKVGKTAKIQGFRPGKAPIGIIMQRYGDSIRAEVIEETVSESTHKTLSERKLRPAMQPKIEVTEYSQDKDLEFKLMLEVLPEITLTDFSKFKFERHVVEVDEASVIEAITRTAKQMHEPELIAEPRAAKMGDVAVIDFDGSVDGEKQPGMKADGYKLELGSKSFIDTFEEQIVGMKAGSSKDIKVKFPADYQAKNLAGKTAVFEVKLNELRAQKEVVLNDELAKELGFDTLDALKKRVSDDIGANYVKSARSVLKRSLLDKLSETHKFEVPSSLLEGEFESIWQQVQQNKKRGNLSEDEMKKSDDDLTKEYRKIAERRIKLGLLLAEVGNQQKIVVSNIELRDAMMNAARSFPGQEKAVFDYYTKTEGALERLRAPILEEKTVDYILSKATLTDKKISADDLLKLQDDED
ncbi:MAG: trigger factor [Alphaproteobacteria bacterium]|nr:trigger factor [Alphaproteobacteria bacterium]